MADEFDALHGTDTEGTVALRDLTIASPNVEYGQAYQTTRAEVLADVVRFLDEDVGEFTFVDLGCGKGRMLLAAAELGFKAVVGVDFAPELVEVAEANIARVRAPNVRAVTGDAAGFDFPSGDLMVFMYNPFLAAVMEPVIERLGEQRTGQLYLIYRYPKCRPVVEAADYLGYVGETPGWEGERGVHIWKGRD